jgi:hypothetical protein
MVTVPVFVGSSTLVAVTTTLPATLGAVNSPLVEMEPAFTDQVSAELKLPVPWTVALHCEVASGAMLRGEQTGTMEEIVGEPGEGEPAIEPPPHAESMITERPAKTANGRRFFIHLLLNVIEGDDNIDNTSRDRIHLFYTQRNFGFVSKPKWDCLPFGSPLLFP